MEKIEKTHPSLVAYDKKVAPIYSDDDRSCMAYSVQKHTIDKAVFKEAINKHFVCGYEQGLSGAVHSRHCRKCALLKELGLEE